ncbi:trna-dihydrouridine synthase 3-like, partial [Moniliophthora roreri]
SEAGVLELIKDEEKKARTAISMQAVNFVSPDKQKLLRTKKLPFPIWETYQKEVKALNKEQKPEAAVTQDADGDVVLAETARDDPAPVPRPSTIQSHEPTSPDDIDTSRTRSYVDYGADITCGEMVLATSFLSGSKEEWPLVRRHPSEKAFGVQVAGSKLNALVPTAETGNGSARTFPYRHVSSWDVKLRTGVKHGKNTAHKTMSRLFLEVENGIGALTTGTSNKCVEAVRDNWPLNIKYFYVLAVQVVPPIPIFGNGDCFSYQAYRESLESISVDRLRGTR